MQDIIKIIDEIANKIGMTAKDIIPYYTKWFFLKALGSILSGLFYICLGFYLFQLIKKVYIMPPPSSYFNTPFLSIPWYAIVCLGVGLLMGISEITEAIGDLFSPQAVAIDHLFKNINNLTNR